MQNTTIAQRLLKFTDADAQIRAGSAHSGNICSSAMPQILCVDDDPDISRSIEMRLREYEVTVSRAYFGMQGFWEAMTDHPDLIIMDVAMPNGDGKFVLESLRSNRDTEDIPVVVLTGMRNDDLRSEMFALGANQFLLKPIRFDELFHEISRFVDLRKVLENNCPQPHWKPELDKPEGDEE